MSEEYVEQRSVSGALLGVVAAALLAALGGLVWCYLLQNQMEVAEQRIVAADQKNLDLTEKLEATNARLRATSETLGQTVGMTQKQIEMRTQSIMAQTDKRLRLSWSRSRRRRPDRLARCRPMWRA